MQLVNLARYPHTVDWGDARPWLYVAFAVGMAAFGVDVLRRASRAAHASVAGPAATVSAPR